MRRGAVRAAAQRAAAGQQQDGSTARRGGPDEAEHAGALRGIGEGQDVTHDVPLPSGNGNAGEANVLGT